MNEKENRQLKNAGDQTTLRYNRRYVKMNLLKKTFAIVAAIMLSVSITAISVFAGNLIDKQKIIDYLWDEYYQHSEESPDEAKKFAEGSFKYDLIKDWVNAHYDKDEEDLYVDWTSMYSIESKFKDYYRKYRDEYDLDEDETTNEFVIRKESDTPGEEGEILYRFKLEGDKWNKVDKDGNIIDTFEVKSNYVESSSAETSDTETTETDEDSSDGAHRALTPEEMGNVSSSSSGSYESEVESESRNDEVKSDDKKSDNDPHLPLYIGGGALIGVAGAAIGMKFKGNKNRGK